MARALDLRESIHAVAAAIAAAAPSRRAPLSTTSRRLCALARRRAPRALRGAPRLAWRLGDAPLDAAFGPVALVRSSR